MLASPADGRARRELAASYAEDIMIAAPQGGRFRTPAVHLCRDSTQLCISSRPCLDANIANSPTDSQSAPSPSIERGSHHSSMNLITLQTTLRLIKRSGFQSLTTLSARIAGSKPFKSHVVRQKHAIQYFIKKAQYEWARPFGRSCFRECWRRCGSRTIPLGLG